MFHGFSNKSETAKCLQETVSKCQHRSFSLKELGSKTDGADAKMVFGQSLSVQDSSVSCCEVEASWTLMSIKGSITIVCRTPERTANLSERNRNRMKQVYGPLAFFCRLLLSDALLKRSEFFGLWKLKEHLQKTHGTLQAPFPLGL